MKAVSRFRERGLRPKKRYGQNFLSDPRTCSSIADAAVGREPRRDTDAAPIRPFEGTVLEIGAGLGALTAPLLERARHVIAVERDPDLIPLLREAFADALDAGVLDLIEGDATELSWEQLLSQGPKPYVLCGNLPYLITGKLVSMAIALADHIDRAVFMVQKEVADRLGAQPATADYGALSVFTQAAFAVKKLMLVRAGAFFPRPEVDSAVVLLSPHRPRRANETKSFAQAVHAAFQQRRKTLRNAWKGLYGWSPGELERAAEQCAISLDARGETLGVEAFARIAALAPDQARPPRAEKP